jgi:hypothetical protein
MGYDNARQMYAFCISKQFQFEHCWVILKKKEPKWQYERANQQQKVMLVQVSLHQLHLLLILLVYDKIVNR